ncbi:diguanylate cyclase [Thiorhodococcus drewsii AZ1]|uniref:diguanylate cyclase n=1 Tax=Thiorhodococcus drewsii AZ1 TaxID=765913 RepID=G2E7M9_9GAMM|nr:GGDEF domain-containing protein [Thiorhodococcus drewsii]EGV27913.1 diguanylate cyclase [Thiorhodococcus drewsii AZ1]
MNRRHSLTARTLRLAAIRIGLVSICAGVASYLVNLSSIEASVRGQLLLSTEQTIQRESLPFRAIRDFERNFLDDFDARYADPGQRAALAADFDRLFVRHPDGSYTQRPGIFEGQPLPDGRRFPGMSATYAPETPPTEDIKTRFTLSFVLSYKYGSVTRGRLFNIYGPLPEKGFPVHQSADIAKGFTYGGPDALRLETYEFYARGFAANAREPFMTRMYFDSSNQAWMTTFATPDTPDAAGRHRILACVDVLLDDLMRRLARPAIEGAYSTLFLADDEGTLMFHPKHMETIEESDGQASIRSLGLEGETRLLSAGAALAPGQVVLVDTPGAIVAVGRIPETPAILTIHYPRALMRPAILQNLAVVVAVGLLTLLVEIVILRNILRFQVARPLEQLIRATRLLGSGTERKVEEKDLPTGSRDEIGDLARAFAGMAEQVQSARAELESKVLERTLELEAANRKLAAMSTTDSLTDIANRRRFDAALEEEWRRAMRSGSSLTLSMIDVDWFKKYNDRYGHQSGDACLRQIARVLESTARRAGDLVARYGGEEFTLITCGTTPSCSPGLPHAIRAAVEQLQLPHADSPFHLVTVSIGVACRVPMADQTPDSLLQEADAALYRAKAEGRNRVVVLC